MDEDSQAQLLVKLLRNDSHDVLTINEAGLSGSEDAVVLDYARLEGRSLLTQNCRDFEVLHQANPNHPGILAVYRDSNPSKNMSFKDIIRAIANLEVAEVPVANYFIALNQWNY